MHSYRNILIFDRQISMVRINWKVKECFNFILVNNCYPFLLVLKCQKLSLKGEQVNFKFNGLIYLYYTCM